MKRNPAGGALEARLDAIETIDDRSFVLRLNKPYPHLRVLLSQFIIPPVMMPERLATHRPVQANPGGDRQRPVPLAGG